MSQFQYKANMNSLTIDVDKTGFNYKTGFGGEKVSAEEISGLGIAIATPRITELNRAKYEESELDIKASPQNLKEKIPSGVFQQAFLLIAKSSGDGQLKPVYIPLDVNDGQCVAMLEVVRDVFKDKYVGIGFDLKVKKVLGLPVIDHYFSLANMKYVWPMMIAFFIFVALMYYFLAR